jgi:hypothetical protein
MAFMFREFIYGTAGSLEHVTILSVYSRMIIFWPVLNRIKAAGLGE